MVGDRLGVVLGDHDLEAVAKAVAPAVALRVAEQPLPRRAATVIVSTLEESAAKKLKLFGRGMDRETANALLALLRGSTDPQIQAAMANPAIMKLAGK